MTIVLDASAKRDKIRRGPTCLLMSLPYDTARSASHRYGRLPGIHRCGAARRWPHRNGSADSLNRRPDGCPPGRPHHVRGPAWRSRFGFAASAHRGTTGRADYGLGGTWRRNLGARLSDRLDWWTRSATTAAATSSTRAASRGMIRSLAAGYRLPLGKLIFASAISFPRLRKE
jgi:hypothetical protein